MLSLAPYHALSRLSLLAVFILSVAPALAAFQAVAPRGNAFFINGTNERFYIRGVAYQPGGSSKLIDPIANVDNLKRDIAYFKQLGINAIRVYSIDNTANHDEGMKMLSDADMGVVLDVNIPKASIARDSGAACSYNSLYVEQVLATVDMMSKYENVIAYVAGNEVINDLTSTLAAPFVKAVVRDIKQFQRNTGLPLIAVTYAAADVSENRLASAHYFNCGDDEMARVDAYSSNDYSWCGNSSFAKSGYDQKVKMLLKYSIPYFFAEVGCNLVSPRPFSEMQYIYSPIMTRVVSGALAYEYSEELNNFGLVLISPDQRTVTPNADFENLKNQFSSVLNPPGDGDFQSGLAHSTCPEKSQYWEAPEKIPDTPKGALKYIKGTASPKGDGFNGNTQWACVAAGNNVDDSGSSGSSGNGSGGSSGSSSSPRKSSGHQATFSTLSAIVSFFFAIMA